MVVLIINKMMKGLMDRIYGTGQVRKNYALHNPDETVLAADACKGIVTETNQGIQRGLDWVTSQRAVILLTDKNIICGKWVIPLNAVAAAQLVQIKTLSGSGQVLKLQTEDGTGYQFGMQANPEWTSQQTLPLTPQKGQVTYSLYSIVVRLLAVGLLLHWLYTRFIAG